jgi:hypothetical protein
MTSSLSPAPCQGISIASSSQTLMMSRETTTVELGRLGPSLHAIVASRRSDIGYQGQDRCNHWGTSLAVTNVRQNWAQIAPSMAQLREASLTVSQLGLWCLAVTSLSPTPCSIYDTERQIETGVCLPACGFAIAGGCAPPRPRLPMCPPRSQAFSRSCEV